MSDASPLSRARQLASKARAWFSALSRAMRIFVLTTAAATAVVIAYFGWASGHETYAPLFTHLDADDAANIVTKLKEMKVPYRLDESAGTTTVAVPESKVLETRLELAGSGLPRGGGIGFESFDKMHLGATEFEQRVLYRRALEGELSRTIGSLAGVESARVHLVLPEKSVFVARSEPASGTIVVKLRAGRVLSPGDVGAIVHLAAAAVPGLAAERVALVTTDGAMLHKPRKTSDDANATDPDAASDKQAMESAVEERVRTMLEHIVGSGRADVRVAAELDSARVEHVEDHYDPAKSVVRSLDETIERNSADGTMTGIPGAESNLPGAASSTPAAAANVVRETRTRNFEIDHVSEKRVQSGGALRRLTVAVVVDGIAGPDHHAVARGPEELERIKALVASAAGIDARRGDVVTVESAPFVDAEAAASVAAPAPVASGPSFATSALRSRATWGATLGVIVLLAIAAVFLRRKTPRPEKPIAALIESRPVNALEAPRVAELDARAEAIALAAKDPATAALVLRAWLGSTETNSAR